MVEDKLSIENTDRQGRYHGYQEWWDEKNILWLRGNYKNSLESGYIEWNVKGHIGYDGTLVEFHIR